ncbi:MAG: hypothetical protein L6Q97_26950, partial [Thermoanaerobaculia bacterium]|nr:hypothetical protein [Thermoanaerobaculia bacterium]
GPSPNVFYLTAYASFYDRLNSQISPDSLFAFRMDASDGSVVSTWGISADNAQAGVVFPLHLEAFEESVLFFYCRNYTAWYTEIKSDGTSSEPKGFFFGIAEEQSPQIYGRHFERHNDGVYFMRLNNAAKHFFAPGGIFSTVSLPVNFSQINDMAGLPDGDLLVVGGQTDGRFQILRYDVSTQQAKWQIPFPFSGQINRVLQDSDTTFVVLGSTPPNSLFLQKYRLSGDTFPVWTEVLTTTDGIVSVAEITVDKASSDLILAGTYRILGNPNLADNAFLLWRMDAQANTLYRLIRYSDVPGPFNQINTVLSLPGGRTLVGGGIHHKVYGKVGFVWGLPAVLNQASGRAWFDINDDQQYDAGESGWQQPLIAMPGNYLIWPDSNGIYRFFAPGTGAYQLSVASPSPWFEVHPASVQFDSTQQVIQGANIRLTAKQQVADAKIQLILLDEVRFGFPIHFLVRAENIGTIPTDSLQFRLSCSSDFALNTLVPLRDTLPVLSLPAPDSPAYRFTGLPPLGHRSFVVEGYLTRLLKLGDTLQCEIGIQPFPMADGDTTNNFERVYFEVVGSYDPNDIAAFPGGRFEYDL